ncbi:chloride channel protein [Sporosarcina sp. NCCP-2716]|uniref:VWA domain-containing protein n=1 Tax=Sporosarcina sp. NCCP-2716 TaxID=2943679 RepID=UPI00203E3C4D|nr:VWA domain-containing protein [Sporosarcina sp. NCCP-2716]GKV67648.1 chloride channel protein [Sporosarcina sp. NCCP-2716]
MDIRIEHPLWLLLLLPLIAYLVFAWKTPGRKSGRTRLIFLFRTAASVLLISALATPYLVLPNDREQILIVADRSASAGASAKEIDGFIDAGIRYRKDHQSAGIYSFAGDFRTDVPLSDAIPHPGEPRVMQQPGETDIEKAVSLALAAADSRLAARIVLLSDGRETKGDIRSYTRKLTGGRVQIDALALPDADVRDAAVTKLELPRTAYAGQQQLMTVEVESSDRMDGTLMIYEDDRLLGENRVTLVPGVNQFTYPVKTDRTGLLKYEAKLVADDDHFLENNRLFAAVSIQGKPAVLVVETEDDPSVIPGLLDSSAVQVTAMKAEELPATLTGYMPYSAIIFDNVPGTLVGEEKMGLIEQAVKNFGTGFLMTGGENSFGLGGYFKTPVEKLLPVEMEVKGKEELPSLGLVIVMDRSGSMSGSKLTLAREAAARSVDLLREQDTFGFTAFDEQIWEIVPASPLEDKEDVTAKILSVSAGGGTMIFPSVEKAYADLAELKLQRKHIILLTDGQSPMPPGYLDTIAEGKSANTTLSTVGIGADADQRLLEGMAEAGGGRYYGVTDESTVPAILSRETITMTRTYIEDDPFYMQLGGIADWNELFAGGVPQMNAYIATSVKQTADTAGKSPKGDPILAEWKYGLGRTAAFTSDSSGKWSGGLAAWDRYPDFWQTALKRILPSYSSAPFTVTQGAGGTFTISDEGGKSAFLEVTAVTEDGKEIEVTEEQTAPGKVTVTLDTEPGLVYLGVKDDQGAFFETGVTVPYGDEYRPGKTDMALLKQLTDQTGGRLLTDPKEMFRAHPYKSHDERTVTAWLLFAALLFFFADITLRRFSRILPKAKPASPAADLEAEPDTNISKLLKQQRRR